VSPYLVLVLGLLAGTLLTFRTPALPLRSRPGPAGALVVIPARNEADALPLLLGDLAHQRCTPARIVVVDDASLDGTGALARAAGAEVREAPPTPPGWNPKSWAVHTGLDGATEAHLVLLDADVRLGPGALEQVVALLEERGGVVSVAPHHEPGSPAENLSLPFNLVALMGAGGGRPGRGDARAAFGPCLALERGLYQRIGGHQRDRGDLLDDVALARRARQAGAPVHLFRGGDVVRYRMYRGGLRQIVDGWTKNIAAGATRTALPTTLGVVAWVTALLVPLVLVAQARSLPALASAAVAWAAVSAHTAALSRAVGRFSLSAAGLAPLLGLAFVGIVGRSALLLVTRRPVRWKDRALVHAPSEPDHD
jgi:4,4'-diaponeurosporenoate glycosyltransferase